MGSNAVAGKTLSEQAVVYSGIFCREPLEASVFEAASRAEIKNVGMAILEGVEPALGHLLKSQIIARVIMLIALALALLFY